MKISKIIASIFFALVGIFWSGNSQAAVFLDGSTTGCANGENSYQPASRSCGGGADTAYLYIDGSLAGSNNTYVSKNIGGAVILMTRYTGEAQFNTNGSIDEVRVYNRALSSDEVGDLYRMGQARIAR